MKCSKKKYDEIGAKIALSNTYRTNSKKRQEVRFYFHKQCKAYHLTSEKKK